jgi:hypothetical protein
MTCVLIKRGYVGTYTHAEVQHYLPMKIEDWSIISVGQGTPKTVGDHWKLDSSV